MTRSKGPGVEEQRDYSETSCLLMDDIGDTVRAGQVLQGAASSVYGNFHQWKEAGGRLGGGLS